MSLTAHAPVWEQGPKNRSDEIGAQLMTETDASVKLPVTVRHNPGSDKSRRYTATYGAWPHDVEAEGSTAAEAKTALVAAITTAMRTMLADKPAFARNDDGALYVAVPAYDGGSDWWRVDDESARRNTSSSRPATEAFASIHHMTVIPSRP